jgi:hypothetical protein
LRSLEDQRLSGLVETRLNREQEFGEVELTFGEPRPKPRLIAKKVQTLVEEPKVIPSPQLEPMEVAGPVQQPLGPASPIGNSTQPTIAPPQPVTPNRGKGSPLHTSVKAGKSIVYVLDCSSSMGRGQKLKEACAALLASLEQLGPEAEFQIVLYHSSAEKLPIRGSTELVPASIENQVAVREALKQLTAQGTSKHVEGLKKALLLRPSAIFLLTDADDLTEEHLITIGLLNRSQTVIYPVLFGQAERLTRNSLLDRLAQANRGRVIARE